MKKISIIILIILNLTGTSFAKIKNSSLFDEKYKPSKELKQANIKNKILETITLLPSLKSDYVITSIQPDPIKELFEKSINPNHQSTNYKIYDDKNYQSLQHNKSFTDIKYPIEKIPNTHEKNIVNFHQKMLRPQIIINNSINHNISQKQNSNNFGTPQTQFSS